MLFGQFILEMSDTQMCEGDRRDFTRKIKWQSEENVSVKKISQEEKGKNSSRAVKKENKQKREIGGTNGNQERK